MKDYTCSFRNCHYIGRTNNGFTKHMAKHSLVLAAAKKEMKKPKKAKRKRRGGSLTSLFEPSIIDQKYKEYKPYFPEMSRQNVVNQYNSIKNDDQNTDSIKDVPRALCYDFSSYLGKRPNC